MFVTHVEPLFDLVKLTKNIIKTLLDPNFVWIHAQKRSAMEHVGEKLGIQEAIFAMYVRKDGIRQGRRPLVNQ
jgi:hypothetical protein